MRLYKTQKTASKYNLIYYQGKPCRNGHGGVRYTKCNRCVECMSKRYKRLKLATPKWVNLVERTQINNLYQSAKLLSIDTAIAYSVDHFYPLFGKNVSGLHTITNLVIITHQENMFKKNKHPDTLYNKPHENIMSK